MTSLAQQLFRFRKAGDAARVEIDPRAAAARSSLMFTREVAQDIDRETLQALAADGLMRLIRVDSRFGLFLSTLFAPSAARADRNTMTPSAACLLDAQIIGFLGLATPHALSTPVHQCLEFLIRHFNIHIHPPTADALLRTFLPFHSSAVFARVLSLVSLAGTPWDFLMPAASAAVPLTTAALVALFVKNPLRLSSLLVPFAPPASPAAVFAHAAPYVSLSVRVVLGVVQAFRSGTQRSAHAAGSATVAAATGGAGSAAAASGSAPPDRAVADIVAFGSALVTGTVIVGPPANSPTVAAASAAVAAIGAVLSGVTSAVPAISGTAASDSGVSQGAIVVSIPGGPSAGLTVLVAVAIAVPLRPAAFPLVLIPVFTALADVRAMPPSVGAFCSEPRVSHLAPATAVAEVASTLAVPEADESGWGEASGFALSSGGDFGSVSNWDGRTVLIAAATMAHLRGLAHDTAGLPIPGATASGPPPPAATPAGLLSFPSDSVALASSASGRGRPLMSEASAGDGGAIASSASRGLALVSADGMSVLRDFASLPRRLQRSLQAVWWAGLAAELRSIASVVGVDALIALAVGAAATQVLDILSRASRRATSVDAAGASPSAAAHARASDAITFSASGTVITPVSQSAPAEVGFRGRGRPAHHDRDRSADGHPDDSSSSGSAPFAVPFFTGAAAALLALAARPSSVASVSMLAGVALQLAHAARTAARRVPPSPAALHLSLLPTVDAVSAVARHVLRTLSIAAPRSYSDAVTALLSEGSSDLVSVARTHLTTTFAPAPPPPEGALGSCETETADSAAMFALLCGLEEDGASERAADSNHLPTSALPSGWVVAVATAVNSQRSDTRAQGVGLLLGVAERVAAATAVDPQATYAHAVGVAQTSIAALLRAGPATPATSKDRRPARSRVAAVDNSESIPLGGCPVCGSTRGEETSLDSAAVQRVGAFVAFAQSMVHHLLTTETDPAVIATLFSTILRCFAVLSASSALGSAQMLPRSAFAALRADDDTSLPSPAAAMLLYFGAAAAIYAQPQHGAAIAGAAWRTPSLLSSAAAVLGSLAVSPTASSLLRCATCIPPGVSAVASALANNLHTVADTASVVTSGTASATSGACTALLLGGPALLWLASTTLTQKAACESVAPLIGGVAQAAHRVSESRDVSPTPMRSVSTRRSRSRADADGHDLLSATSGLQIPPLTLFPIPPSVWAQCCEPSARADPVISANSAVFTLPTPGATLAISSLITAISLSPASAAAAPVAAAAATEIASDVSASPGAVWAAGVALVVLASAFPMAVVAAAPSASFRAAVAALPRHAVSTVTAAVHSARNGRGDSGGDTVGGDVGGRWSLITSAWPEAAKFSAPATLPAILLAASSIAPEAVPAAAVAAVALGLARTASAGAVALYSDGSPTNDFRAGGAVVLAAAVLAVRFATLAVRVPSLLAALCERVSLTLGPLVVPVLAFALFGPRGLTVALPARPPVDVLQSGADPLSALAASLSSSGAVRVPSVPTAEVTIVCKVLLTHCTRHPPAPSAGYVATLIAATTDSSIQQFALKALVALGAAHSSNAFPRALASAVSSAIAGGTNVEGGGDSQPLRGGRRDRKGSESGDRAVRAAAPSEAAGKAIAPCSWATMSTVLVDVFADAADWDFASVDQDEESQAHSLPDKLRRHHQSPTILSADAFPAGGILTNPTNVLAPIPGLQADAVVAAHLLGLFQPSGLASAVDAAAPLVGPARAILVRLLVGAAALGAVNVLTAVIPSVSASVSASLLPRVLPPLSALASASSAVDGQAPRPSRGPAVMRRTRRQIAHLDSDDDEPLSTLTPLPHTVPWRAGGIRVLRAMLAAVVRPFLTSSLPLPEDVLDMYLTALVTVPSSALVAVVATCPAPFISDAPVRTIRALAHLALSGSPSTEPLAIRTSLSSAEQHDDHVVDPIAAAARAALAVMWPVTVAVALQSLIPTSVSPKKHRASSTAPVNASARRREQRVAFVDAIALLRIALTASSSVLAVDFPSLGSLRSNTLSSSQKEAPQSAVKSSRSRRKSVGNVEAVSAAAAPFIDGVDGILRAFDPEERALRVPRALQAVGVSVEEARWVLGGGADPRTQTMVSSVGTIECLLNRTPSTAGVNADMGGLPGDEVLAMAAEFASAAAVAAAAAGSGHRSGASDGDEPISDAVATSACDAVAPAVASIAGSLFEAAHHDGDGSGASGSEQHVQSVVDFFSDLASAARNSVLSALRVFAFHSDSSSSSVGVKAVQSLSDVFPQLVIASVSPPEGSIAASIPNRSRALGRALALISSVIPVQASRTLALAAHSLGSIHQNPSSRDASTLLCACGIRVPAAATSAPCMTVTPSCACIAGLLTMEGGSIIPSLFRDVPLYFAVATATNSVPAVALAAADAARAVTGTIGLLLQQYSCSLCSSPDAHNDGREAVDRLWTVIQSDLSPQVAMRILAVVTQATALSLDGESIAASHPATCGCQTTQTFGSFPSLIPDNIELGLLPAGAPRGSTDAVNGRILLPPLLHRVLDSSLCASVTSRSEDNSNEIAVCGCTAAYSISQHPETRAAEVYSRVVSAIRSLPLETVASYSGASAGAAAASTVFANSDREPIVALTRPPAEVARHLATFSAVLLPAIARAVSARQPTQPDSTASDKPLLSFSTSHLVAAAVRIAPVNDTARLARSLLAAAVEAPPMALTQAVSPAKQTKRRTSSATASPTPSAHLSDSALRCAAVGAALVSLRSGLASIAPEIHASSSELSSSDEKSEFAIFLDALPLLTRLLNASMAGESATSDRAIPPGVRTMLSFAIDATAHVALAAISALNRESDAASPALDSLSALIGLADGLSQSAVSALASTAEVGTVPAVPLRILSKASAAIVHILVASWAGGRPVVSAVSRLLNPSLLSVISAYAVTVAWHERVRKSLCSASQESKSLPHGLSRQFNSDALEDSLRLCGLAAPSAGAGSAGSRLRSGRRMEAFPTGSAVLALASAAASSMGTEDAGIEAVRAMGTTIRAVLTHVGALFSPHVKPVLALSTFASSDGPPRVLCAAPAVRAAVASVAFSVASSAPIRAVLSELSNGLHVHSQSSHSSHIRTVETTGLSVVKALANGKTSSRFFMDVDIAIAAFRLGLARVTVPISDGTAGISPAMAIATFLCGSGVLTKCIRSLTVRAALGGFDRCRISIRRRSVIAAAFVDVVASLGLESRSWSGKALANWASSKPSSKAALSPDDATSLRELLDNPSSSTCEMDGGGCFADIERGERLRVASDMILVALRTGGPASLTFAAAALAGILPACAEVLGHELWAPVTPTGLRGGLIASELAPDISSFGKRHRTSAMDGSSRSAATASAAAAAAVLTVGRAESKLYYGAVSADDRWPLVCVRAPDGTLRVAPLDLPMPLLPSQDSNVESIRPWITDNTLPSSYAAVSQTGSAAQQDTSAIASASPLSLLRGRYGPTSLAISACVAAWSFLARVGQHRTDDADGSASDFAITSVQRVALCRGVVLLTVQAMSTLTHEYSARAASGRARELLLRTGETGCAVLWDVFRENIVEPHDAAAVALDQSDDERMDNDGDGADRNQQSGTESDIPVTGKSPRVISRRRNARARSPSSSASSSDAPPVPVRARREKSPSDASSASDSSSVVSARLSGRPLRGRKLQSTSVADLCSPNAVRLGSSRAPPRGRLRGGGRIALGGNIQAVFPLTDSHSPLQAFSSDVVPFDAFGHISRTAAVTSPGEVPSLPPIGTAIRSHVLALEHDVLGVLMHVVVPTFAAAVSACERDTEFVLWAVRQMLTTATDVSVPWISRVAALEALRVTVCSLGVAWASGDAVTELLHGVDAAGKEAAEDSSHEVREGFAHFRCFAISSCSHQVIAAARLVQRTVAALTGEILN